MEGEAVEVHAEGDHMELEKKKGEATTTKGSSADDSKSGKKRKQREFSSPASDRPARERKSIERFVVSPEKEIKEFKIQKGAGSALKDIPNIVFKLSKRRGGDEVVQSLHKVLFGKTAKHVAKANILQFSGYVWSGNEEKEKAKVKERLERCVRESLFQISDLLDLSLSKSLKKEDGILRVFEFLESPHKTTDKLVEENAKAKKSKKAKKTPVKGSKKKASGKSPKRAKKAPRKKQTSDEEHGIDAADLEEPEEKSEDDVEKEPEEKSEDDVEEEPEEKSEDDVDEEPEEKSEDDVEEEPEEKSDDDYAERSTSSKKRKRKTTKKQSMQESGDKEETSPKKKKPLKKEAKKKEKKKPIKEAKKEKKPKAKAEKSKEPSDEDLQEAICELLQNADFSKVTFTDVMKRLGEKFKVDLTHRKAHLKALIQEEIAKLVGEGDNEDEDGNTDGENADGEKVNGEKEEQHEDVSGEDDKDEDGDDDGDGDGDGDGDEEVGEKADGEDANKAGGGDEDEDAKKEEDEKAEAEEDST